MGDAERGGVVLVPSAELDIASADVLACRVADALRQRPARLEVEWSGVTFCDSSGLRVLVTAVRSARAVDCQFSLRHPSRSLLRLAQPLRRVGLVGLPLPPPAAALAAPGEGPSGGLEEARFRRPPSKPAP